jgi:hypothetical protein
MAKAMSRAGAVQVLLLARNEERPMQVANAIDAEGGKAGFIQRTCRTQRLWIP